MRYKKFFLCEVRPNPHKVRLKMGNLKEWIITLVAHVEIYKTLKTLLDFLLISPCYCQWILEDRWCVSLFNDLQRNGHKSTSLFFLLERQSQMATNNFYRRDIFLELSKVYCFHRTHHKTNNFIFCFHSLELRYKPRCSEYLLHTILKFTGCLRTDCRCSK